MVQKLGKTVLQMPIKPITWIQPPTQKSLADRLLGAEGIFGRKAPQT